MGPMGVLLTLPSRSCVLGLGPSRGCLLGAVANSFRYAGIQPRRIEPTSQGGQVPGRSRQRHTTGANSMQISANIAR
jgi:hypothetical protein